MSELRQTILCLGCAGWGSKGYEGLCIKSRLLCLEVLSFFTSSSNTFHTSSFFPILAFEYSPFQISQAFASILNPAFRPTVHYRLKHLHLYQGQLEKSMYTMTDHVDVDSDVESDGEAQGYMDILRVRYGDLVEGDTRRWHFDTVRVKLSDVGEEEGEIDESSCNKIEKTLGVLPDPAVLEDIGNGFKWEHRTLVKVRGLPARRGQVERADYLMYVRLEKPTAVVRNNRLLEGLVESSPEVYGSAFVLKKRLNSGERDDSKMVWYLPSREDDFVEEKERDFLEGHILTALMRALKYGRAYSPKASVESAPPLNREDGATGAVKEE